MEGELKIPDEPRERKSAFARTLADYAEMPISAPILLKENPGKTLAEIMDDKAVHTYLQRAVDALDILKDGAEKGNKGDQIWLERNIRDYFVYDTAYLRTIGRLPPEFDFDPYARFKVTLK